MATKGKSNRGGKKTTASTSKNSGAKKNTKRTSRQEDRLTKVIIGALLIALGMFFFFSVTFKATGEVGRIFGDFLKGTMGMIGLFVPIYIMILGLVLAFGKSNKINAPSIIISLIGFLMLALINSGRFINADKIAFDANDFFNKGITLESGGLFGMSFAMLLVKYIGKVGLYLVSFAILALCIFLLLRNLPLGIWMNKFTSWRQDVIINSDEKQKAREERREISRRQRAEIEEKQVKVDAIKEERRRRRLERREELKERTHSTLDQISLFGDDHNSMPETSSTIDIGPDSKQTPGRYGFGLEPQSVVMPGLGLQDDEPVDLAEVYDEDRTKINDSVAVIDDVIPEYRETSDFGYDEIPTEEPVVNTPSPSVKQKQKDAESQAGTPVYDTPKMTKAEAQGAMLTKEDFNKPKKHSKYKKPGLELLKSPDVSGAGSVSNQDLQQQAELLERTLQSFNVDAKVINVTKGPSVTRFEIQPAFGVKVSRIVNLADDIALNMRAKSLRIEAPIPGRPVVGIEIGNNDVSMVSIKELIGSKEFKQSKSNISFCVGKDISGNPIVADLKEMPHLLIAGSTGSGKSVCINSIIVSLLYKADPEKVKLVMIDPKVVELGDYNGIPHLLTDVVTDPNKAAAALNWAVAEMTNRYKLFAEAHVKDIEGYNAYVESLTDDYDSRAEGIEKPEQLPQVVIIIDELADLMMTAHAQVEDAICRLAQLARAAGMHLIVATQRPSVNVVTGTIKTNIPSRIAFTVASQYDSRTILDMSGAEKLGGKGDMLYAPFGANTPIRVQGCFISPDEIHDVIDFVKNQKDAEYSTDLLDTMNKGDTQASSSEAKDELYEDALRFVIDAGKASSSMIQRRFRIGYNRAANIIDQMEMDGYIGPADGAKPRQVYATMDMLNPGAAPVQEEQMPEPPEEDTTPEVYYSEGEEEYLQGENEE